MGSLLFYVSAVYCLLWLAWLAYVQWRLATRAGAPAPVPLPAPLPRVSILLAARNEAAALPRCLASVRALAYPPTCSKFGSATTPAPTPPAPWPRLPCRVLGVISR